MRRKTLRHLAVSDKGVEIIETEACPDHIHMLVSIPPKYSVSQFMGYLKGKSSLMIFDRHANLKYKYGNRQFWCKGYYVDTVGRNKKAIAEYIRNHLQEDKISDQMTIKEYYSLFLLFTHNVLNRKRKSLNYVQRRRYVKARNKSASIANVERNFLFSAAATAPRLHC